jgi:hypothetical protein
VKAVSNSRPVLTSYHLKFIDPNLAQQVASAELGGRAIVRMASDLRLGTLHVYAQPEDQAAVQAILISLDQRSPTTPPATAN